MCMIDDLDSMLVGIPTEAYHRIGLDPYVIELYAIESSLAVGS